VVAVDDPALLPDRRYLAGVTAPAEDVGFVPGTVLLDRYRVVRALGIGGMSQVVCAEHLALGTKVAMKFLLPGLAILPDAPQRFVREALAVTRVKSDHVAKVLDVGTLPGGPPYLVMEYLEGQDLGRHVKAGQRFEVEEAIDLTVQAADALARAHAAGVIHRDVKPSNLFLTSRPDGTPLLKVLDFGISKVLEEAAKEDLELTKTTAVMGSALYMSLEQMRSTKTVDHRTDIYALGVSLYELLTGTHPFTAESFSELCVKVSLDPPSPLRDHRPDVPEALAEAIAVAYARSAAERYQTVGGFALALAPFASPRTLEHIDSIRRFERQSWPDGTLPERQPTPHGLRATDVRRPPRPGWLAYAVLVGAGLTAAAALWVLLGQRTTQGSSGATEPDDASTVDAASPVPPDSTLAPSGVLPIPSTPSEPVDGGPADAGRRDAGKGKLPRPCRPGEMIRLPNGLLKPCGL
jgi:serine/threonine protein kinase